MTNKDYKRLTSKNAIITGRFSGKTLLNRLTDLENAIENGTLMFLPCKVGDEFWWIFHASKSYIVDEKVQSIEISEEGISIIDCDGTGWYLSEIYFTKEAAKKALEELEK